ncbi:hypothetical protein GCM10023195_00360 [Actinoallomurus liliacearum]|uniref:Pentapeptide repeat-containing protein n=1 Tax=Actinoallomurus liliacearum TaxID=1080073 RepID=A0ABP8TAP9_9ACTN
MREDEVWELRLRRERETTAGLWPIGRALAVAGLSVAVGLAMVTVVALAVLGFPHLARHKDLSVGDLLDVLKLVLGTVAGAGALAALVMNYRKQRVAEVAETRDRVRVFNERFTTAAGQLGHDEAAVRLAGIYAMAGLADDWEHGRQTCIDVLCAYLRMPYEPDPGSGAPAAEGLVFGRNQEVRHAIIKVITTHLRSGARVSWRGHDFDFTGARFDGGDFSHAKFIDGEISFTGAEFTGGTVSFAGAEFRSEVSFARAEFTGGVVDFSGAEFTRVTSGTVSFSGAQFTGGEVSFGGAQFTSGVVDFSGAVFIDGTADFSGAQFTGSTVDFSGADFTGGEVIFSGAGFIVGKISFTHAEFTSGTVTFTGAGFIEGEVTFSGARFTGGTVDLHDLRFTKVSPSFDEAVLASPPEGLRLPATATAPQPGETSGR